MKVLPFLAAALLLFIAQSCHKKGCTDPAAINYNEGATKDDGSCQVELIECPVYNENEHAGVLSSNQTWTANEIHILIGRVIVPSGGTLTIEPGTIIKAKEGSGTLSSMLIVAKGGKIHAEGTTQAPIIFTSILDDILPGQITGSVLDENDKGLWGGIVILGDAPISAADGDTYTAIEGLPTDPIEMYYGGSNPTDDSGIFRYVSIRHAGTLIGAGNESNALTLGGIGSQTEIDHIETIACEDDGIQVFGGTVALTNIAIAYSGDDGLETSQNFDGSVTNALILCHASSDKGIDMRGPMGTTYTGGTASLDGISVVHEQGGNVISQFRGDVKGTISNVHFGGDIRLTASYINDCQNLSPDVLYNMTVSTPVFTFSNCQRGALNLYTASTGSTQSLCPISSSDQSAAESVFPSVSTSGSDNSHFQNWTWLASNGKL